MSLFQRVLQVLVCIRQAKRPKRPEMWAVEDFSGPRMVLWLLTEQQIAELGTVIVYPHIVSWSSDLSPWYCSLSPRMKQLLLDCHSKDAAEVQNGFEDCISDGRTWCPETFRTNERW
jgi:hypothetical protein